MIITEPALVICIYKPNYRHVEKLNKALNKLTGSGVGSRTSE
jgi:hypothetical protein